VTRGSFALGRVGDRPRERLLPEGTEVPLVSEKVEKYGRTLGRFLRRDGRDISQEVLKVSHAVVL
jgi:endonuclease YncB( thermonuclease family)